MPNQMAMDRAPLSDAGKAKQLFDRGEAVFVDVRSEADYRKAHIPMAVSMPLREVPRRYSELSGGQCLVFY